MFVENEEEENNSEYDDDDNDDSSDVLYEPEEIGLTKYTIVLCEQLDEPNHHYLTWYRFKNLDLELINKFVGYVRGNARLEIAECIYLPSHHCVSIIKTFWIRLIQRKWRNICNERKHFIMLTRALLSYREIRANECVKYPTLKGMLSNLG
jgi:hypothetical protein